MKKRYKLGAWFIMVVLIVAGLPVVGMTSNYVIIYHSSLAGDALNDLVQFEINRGFNVTTHAVEDGVTRDSIKSIIMSHYYDDGQYPRYVLLVGTARRSTEAVEGTASASSGNLIPTFYHQDSWGEKSAFDYDYAVMSTSPGHPAFIASHPMTCLGRIPARTTTDLQNYVDKLIYYYNDTGIEDWKKSILAIYGDKERNIESAPKAGMINGDLNNLMALFPQSCDINTIHFSDFGEWLDSASMDARLSAFIAQMDSGQAVVTTMATGANPGNLSYVVYRGNFWPHFDTYSDLQASDKYSVFLAASCQLGAADSVYTDEEGDITFFAENALLAPHRGAVLFIGPSGFSSQPENNSFTRRFVQLLDQYPDLPAGDIFTYAQCENRFSGDSKTLMMYTLYGDPSIPIHLDGPSGTYNRREYMMNGWYVNFDYDYGKPLPAEYDTWHDNTQITDDTARIFSYQGSCLRWYRVSGTDTYEEVDSAYQSWHVYPDIAVPITDSTRFLEYDIRPFSHPEGVARYGVNAVLASGALLSDEIGGVFISDQYGNRIAAKNRIGQTGSDVEYWYAFDLMPVMGDTITELFVEYDAINPQAVGDFAFELGGIVFAPAWGGPPSVGEIDMPSSMNTGAATIAWVYATDYDEALGDTLTFDWSATAGSFTGEGDSVTYHAPGTGQTVTVTLTVTDLGGHVAVRDKQVDVSDGGGGGCPFLYSWTMDGYRLENVLLTESEIYPEGGTIVTDYYALNPGIDSKDGIRLRLAEDENELTSIYAVRLYAYDLSDLADKEGVAIDNRGRLVAVSNRVVPKYAQVYFGEPGEDYDGPVWDYRDLVSAEDGRCFETHIPGNLIVGFDVSDFINNFVRPKPRSDDGGGGGIIEPPGKGGVGEKNLAGTDRRPNYLTVAEPLLDGDQLIDVIWPRIKSAEIPELIDLTDYINPDRNMLNLKLSWSESYRADEISFYTYRVLDLLDSMTASSAILNNNSDVSAELLPGGDDYGSLRPGDHIDLEFNSGGLSGGPIGLVIRVDGYYQKKPFSEGQDIKPVHGIFLQQNQPNPFNASTTIQFTLEQPMDVNVAIFNILGQQVDVICSGHFESGPHSVYWNGTDQAGNHVSSGIYFYKLHAGGYTVAKKMVLLK